MQKAPYSIQLSRYIPRNEVTEALYQAEGELLSAFQKAVKEFAKLTDDGTGNPVKDWRVCAPEMIAMLLDAYSLKHRLVLFDEDRSEDQ